MRRMISAIIASLACVFSWPASAVLLPLSGMDEIVGPWQLNEIYYGHVRLTAYAYLPPVDYNNIAGTIGGYAVYSSFDVAGGAVINASGVGALGNLEVVLANYAGINCTSCSSTGDIIWFGDPLIKHTISWGTGWQNYGNAPGIIQANLYLDLPEGFSLASQQVSAVPEPSTWAMLLIGAAGLWLRLRAPMARCTSGVGARDDQTHLR